MDPSGTQLEYTLDSAQRARFREFLRPAVKRFYYRSLPLAGVAFAVSFAVYLYVTSRSWPIALAFTALTEAMLVAYVGILRRSGRLAKQLEAVVERLEARPIKRRLVIRSDGIERQRRFWSSNTVFWHNVEEWASTANEVYFLAGRSALMIPARAFGSNDEFQAFVEFAATNIEAEAPAAWQDTS